MTHPRPRHRRVRNLRATDPLSLLMGLITFAVLCVILKAIGRI